MTVSVLIPTLNEADEIAASIQSAVDAGADEVIVADGGSTDPTVPIAEATGAHVIRASAGRGTQLRPAAEIASGDYVLILHADNRLHPSCLNELERSHAAWGGCWQRIDAGGVVYRALEYGNAMRIRTRGLVFGDQAMFIRRSLLTAIGGVPTVPLMEDVLLSRQLRRRHRPVLLNSPVQVDARRWQSRGVVGQTLRNWRIQIAHRWGADERRLMQRYQRP